MTRDAAPRIVAKICLLVAIGFIAGAATAPLEPVVVNVVMVDYRFEPDHLTFQHGTRYRLHMENHGKETHELTAPTFFATATIENPDILNHKRSEILVQPGESKDLFLTAGKPGTYDMRCADHDWNGMVGGITVQ